MLTHTIFNFKFLMSSLMGNLSTNNIDLYNVCNVLLTLCGWINIKLIVNDLQYEHKVALTINKSAEDKVKTYRVIREKFSSLRYDRGHFPEKESSYLSFFRIFRCLPLCVFVFCENLLFFKN